jgi:hypothetical protein
VSAADVVQEPVAGAAPAAAAAGPRPPPPPPPLPGTAFVLLPGCYFFARDCGSICCLPCLTVTTLLPLTHLTNTKLPLTHLTNTSTSDNTSDNSNSIAGLVFQTT